MFSQLLELTEFVKLESNKQNIMASKLSYLSKYTLAQNKDAERTSKEKKRKKKTNKANKTINSKSQEFDDDSALPPPPTVDDDEDDDEENRPTLVDTILSSDQPKRQQQWKEEVLTNTSTSRSQHFRRRYDSDDDEPNEQIKLPLDAPEVVHSTSHRYDSDDDDADDELTQDAHKSMTQKHRYDSPDDQPSKRTKHYDSDDDDDNEIDNVNNVQDRMSSGHIAGIQKASDFRDTERILQKSKQTAAQAMVDRHGIGETVHRDDHGRKVQESHTKNNFVINKQDQIVLNKGRAQIDEEARLLQQFKELKDGTFARHADDNTMNSMFKDELRDGDPMLAYAAKKHSTRENNSTLRPCYKGPPPKPNRYGIRPGYRWDGVDRGNGFEDKVLGLKFSAQRKNEDSYRWSSADM